MRQPHLACFRSVYGWQYPLWDDYTIMQGRYKHTRVGQYNYIYSFSEKCLGRFSDNGSLLNQWNMEEPFDISVQMMEVVLG